MWLHQIRDRAAAFPGYFAAVTRCPHCSESVIAPVLSEFVEDRKILHHWHCDACAHVFATEIRLIRD